MQKAEKCGIITAMWMILVLFYGIMKGLRDVIKKKALEQNSVMEVLLVYTFLGCIMIIPEAKEAMGMQPKFYVYVAIKSFVIFVAWTCSFISIKKLPVSLYGVLDLSRVLFTTTLGVTILGETIGYLQGIGLIMVCLGLFMLGRNKKALTTSSGETIPIRFFFLAFASCLLNSVSALLDKILMKDLNSSQLQFWYMLFLLAYYLLYVIISKTHISASAFKNGWIWLLALLFVAADKALFIANSMPGSKITVMTLIKQSGCIVAIIGGRLVFKEKNIIYKLVCASIIIVGIVLGVM